MAKGAMVKHTRYTVKGGKLPTMKSASIKGLKASVKTKGIGVGKKVKSSYANPLRMKAHA